MVQVRVNRKSGRVDPQKNMGQVTGQPVFAFGKKNQVWVSYFSGRVRKF